MIEQFYDESAAGFFYTGTDHEALLMRTKDVQDSPTPSGNGMAATGLLRLAALTGRDDLRTKAEATLTAFHGVIDDSPVAAGQMLLALDFLLGPVQEFAVIGNAADAETKQVLALIRKGFHPNKVLAFREPQAKDDVALLRGKAALGGVTTYICRNFACQAPVVGVKALAQLV